jgi:DNA end-binding protein Ku
MPKSMWSGQLGFGLVQIPVKLFKATENHDIGFHQYHGPKCLGRVGMPRICKDCGEAVDYNDIYKGLELDDQAVIVTPDDLELLADEAGKNIEILEFVEAAEIDPMMFENSYYVGAPDGAKALALLTATMEAKGWVAIARMMLRNKTNLAALRVVDGGLVLQTLLWPDEVRTPEGIQGRDGEFSEAEYEMATMLVEKMVGKFDPDKYTDQYQERLQELIAAKHSGAVFETEPAVAQLDDVSDLLAKLEASVAAHPAGKKRAPAKKAPAKKAAKKAAPRRKKVA